MLNITSQNINNSTALVPITKNKLQQLQFLSPSNITELNTQPGPGIEPKLIKSKISKKKINQFFLNKNYYYLVNLIFQHFTKNIQREIITNLKNTTKINLQYDVNNLSWSAYQESVMNGLSIISNDGSGDCFFLAIAQGINYHNFHNSSDKITNRNSGITIPFTQKYLRNIVLNYILQKINESPQYLHAYNELAQANVNQLNNVFEQHIKDILENNSTPLNEEEYFDIVNAIYTSFDNFLIKYPENVPDEDNYNRPFNAIDINNIMNIKEYILGSNYWANEIAFIALNVELKLNIISIEQKEDHLVINSGTFFNTEEEVNNWNKYIFLYNNKEHFELITFPIFQKKIDQTNKKIINISTTKIIYNRNNFQEFPPLYILFLIYGNKYPITRNLDNKINFSLLKPFMEYIENSLNNILLDNRINQNYINIFNLYFLMQQLERIQNGGTNTNKREEKSSSLTKMFKNENDSAKIAYWIKIDMELHPGTSILPEEMKNIQCRQKWNAVRKAYANMLGKPYIIPPVYENKTLKNKEIQNNTRKIEQDGGIKKIIKSKKNIKNLKNKTIKKLL